MNWPLGRLLQRCKIESGKLTWTVDGLLERRVLQENGWSDGA
jgi:hypothetical protein